MKNELKDILSHSNKDIDNQQLMDYLSNRLPKPGQHELEKAMAEDPFVNDAVEGLQQVKNEASIQGYVDQLNHGLQRQVNRNRQRREKRRWKDQPYQYIALLVILLLVITAFVVLIRFFR